MDIRDVSGLADVIETTLEGNGLQFHYGHSDLTTATYTYFSDTEKVRVTVELLQN